MPKRAFAAGVLLLALALTVPVPVLAQNWTTPVENLLTQGGVLVVYPADYRAEVAGDVISLSGFDLGDTYALTVTTGAAGRRALGGAGSLLLALTEILDSQLALYDPNTREFFGLSNAQAYMQIAQTVTGYAQYVVIQSGEGAESNYVLIEMRSPNASLADMQRQRGLLLNMTNSLRWNVDPASVPTEVAPVLPRVALPEGRLTWAQMPPGTVVLSTGVQITLPDMWLPIEPSVSVADTVGITHTFGDAQVFISSTDLVAVTSVEAWRAQLLSVMGSLITIDRSSGQPKGVLLELETAQAGTTVEYFARPETGFGMALYLVNLNRDAAAALQLTVLTDDPGRVTELIAQVGQIAASARRINRVLATPTPMPTATATPPPTG